MAAVLAAAASPSPSAAQDAGRIKQLTQAYSASGQQLFGRFAAASGNIVFSPYSVGTAMAMALAGARGNTETEMAKVLQLHLSRADIDTANGDVLKVLNGYDKSAPPSARVVSANALMLPGKGAQVSAGYRALLQDRYAAEIFDGVKLEDVNGWVSRKTEGKIDKMLDRLDPDTAAVLLNAIYFKAHWAAAFSKPATRDEAFSLTSSRTVQAPMMRQNAKFSVVTRPGYRAIGLPYDVDALEMIVVLPDDVDGLAAVAARLDAAELAALVAAVEAEPVRLVALTLPRFKTSFKADLKATFRQLGMNDAFDDRRADFSGMTGRPESQGALKIDEIIHRAVIEVMEDGTEAAAATAVIMMPRSAVARPAPPEPFQVDHPFLFYIVDHPTGAILFEGRIVDPR
jgi:serine protease inhibitor